MALYDGQKYAPPVANDLTTSQGEAVARFLDEASRRGMKTYM
jgi:hypothetical protein